MRTTNRNPWLITCLLASIVGGPHALADEPAVKVEFRRAQFESQEGYTKFAPQGTARPVYVSDKTELSNADIAEAKTGLDERGRYNIDITMTDEGGRKLAKLTQEHLLKPLAILVDGKVLMAPIIRSQISKRVQISGDFDKQEAERIAAGILGKQAP